MYMMNIHTTTHMLSYAATHLYTFKYVYRQRIKNRDYINDSAVTIIASLSEYLGSVPSTHKVVHDPLMTQVPQDLRHCSDLCGCEHCVRTYMHAGKHIRKHTYTKEKSEKLEKRREEKSISIASSLWEGFAKWMTLFFLTIIKRTDRSLCWYISSVGHFIKLCRYCD